MSTVELNRLVCLQAGQTLFDLIGQSGEGALELPVALQGARVMQTLVEVIGRPAQAAELMTPGAYFAGTRNEADDLVIEHPLALDEAFDAFADALDALAPDHDPLVQTPHGGMRLSAYLPVVTSKLVVASTQAAETTGHDLIMPADAVRQSIETLADLAVLSGRGPALVSFLTSQMAEGAVTAVPA